MILTGKIGYNSDIGDKFYYTFICWHFIQDRTKKPQKQKNKKQKTNKQKQTNKQTKNPHTYTKCDFLSNSYFGICILGIQLSVLLTFSFVE